MSKSLKDRHDKGTHINLIPCKGVATRSDENEQTSFTGQHETISFIARPATQTRRLTRSTKRWKELNVIVLLLNQLYCLKMSRGFRFLK